MHNLGLRLILNVFIVRLTHPCWLTRKVLRTVIVFALRVPLLPVSSVPNRLQRMSLVPHLLLLFSKNVTEPTVLDLFLLRSHLWMMNYILWGVTWWNWRLRNVLLCRPSLQNSLFLTFIMSLFDRTSGLLRLKNFVFFGFSLSTRRFILHILQLHSSLVNKVVVSVIEQIHVGFVSRLHSFKQVKRPWFLLKRYLLFRHMVC